MWIGYPGEIAEKFTATKLQNAERQDWILFPNLSSIILDLSMCGCVKHEINMGWIETEVLGTPRSHHL